MTEEGKAPAAEQGEPKEEVKQEGLFPAEDTGKLKAENADLRKRLSALETSQKRSQEEQLAKQGEWQKVAETRGGELEQLKASHTKLLKKTALQAAAVSEGLRSMDFLKLVDLDALAIDGDSVTGAAEAISGLKETHPLLFGEQKEGVKTPSVQPGGPKPLADPTRRYSSQDIKGMTDDEFVAWKKAKNPNSNFI